ncbi:MAG: hypothetical protein K8R76_10990 [Candidatus Aegiribacteria sp.]|nr:hypothetical protein [Candidatus Aegiribacteria sp.]
MIGTRRPEGITLFTGAIILLLILWLPVRYTLPGAGEILTLFCIWFGLFYTVALKSQRTIGYPVVLYPAFQAYMSLTGYSIFQEAGFILATFLGSFVYALGSGGNLSDCFNRSLKFMLISLLSLRITAIILQPYRIQALANNYLATVVLVAAVLVAVLINHVLHLLTGFTEYRGIKYAISQYTKSIIYPALFVLFLVPAAIHSATVSRSAWEWGIVTGVTAILIIQTGLSVLIDRARFSFSRTRFLEDELGKHSDILANLKTPIEALRTLARFWFRAAEPEAVRVSWNNISLTYPPGMTLPDDHAPLSRRGTGGLLLEIWPALNTALDAERLEIFVSQTEIVLLNLELRKNVLKSGWKCLEAMVYSLDMSDSKQTGYSKQVATVARNIGREMGMDENSLEDLEMSAMLHLTAAILKKAEEDSQETFSSDPLKVQFQLPPDIVRGIRHITENFDGSGKPERLKGRSIPLISRILSISSDFSANLSGQSIENSILELKRRSGSIYDPEIVSILEGITIRKNQSVFSDIRG